MARTMSISSKTIAAIVAMGVSLTLAVYLLQSQLVYSEFRSLEEEDARANVDRVIHRFDVLLDTIDSVLFDWSDWDETYYFAARDNPGYIGSNLSPDTFRNIGVNVAVFVDSNLEVVWAGIYEFPAEGGWVDVTDTHLDKVMPLIRDYAPKIDREKGVDEQYYSGVFPLDNRPAMFSLRPILLPSDYQAQPSGYLLFATRLTPSQLENFAAQVSGEFEIGPPESHQTLAQQERTRIEQLGSDRLAASSPYMAGQEGGFMVTASVPRDISQAGARATQQAIVFFLLICLAVALIAWWVLRQSVLQPLERLKSDVLHVSATADYSARSRIQTHDEIGLLAAQFNRMLDTVERKHTELQDLNEQLSDEQSRLQRTQEELKQANWELKSLSEKDALTGLFNRLALDRKLDKEWNRLARTGEPLSILLLDIDMFKQYNDHYGHQAGDDCLRQVAIVLETVSRRSSDMAARYGGEEFMVVLPNTSRQQAVKLAQRLVDAIRDKGIVHQYSEVDDRVTISVGIASTIPDETNCVQGLVETADKVLYRAKKNGRARVEADENGSSVG